MHEDRKSTPEHSTLLQTTEEWQEVCNSMQDMLFILNERYEIVKVNQSMANTIGKPVEELLYQPCYRVIHGTDAPPSYCPHKKVLEERKPVSADFFEENLNVHLHVKVSPLHDTEGNFKGSLYIARDITEQKNQERELQSLNENLEQMVAEKTREITIQKNMLQAIFKATPVGIGVVKGDTLHYANPMVTSISGYREEELIGHNPRKLYSHNAEFDFVHTECERQRQRFGNCTIETKWLRKDGLQVDILYSSTPIEFHDHQMGYTFSARDITIKKETEKNLSSAYNEMNQIFNAAVPICFISKGCTITRVNAAFCGYFDIDEKDILGKSCEEFWECTKCNTEDCALHLLESGGANFHRYIDTDLRGKKLVCSVHSVPHYDAHGSFVGTITTFFDMTAYKEAQDQLEKTRDQLLHSEKLSAVGRLSASIAHEFNNPLYGIMNVLSGIKQRNPLNDEDMALTDLALKECNRIKFLISQLQQFNRPSSGVRELFDVHKAIDEILLFHKKEFKTKKIQVRKEYDISIPKIWAVQDQVKQVLVNLLNNAGDAIPELGGIITIATGVTVETIFISVHDDGNGIPPNNIPHIFEPFFTTKPAVKGTGLGLPVSFGIIKSHGGDITVDSTPDEGSTFTVTLPIERRGSDEENPGR